MARRAAVGLTVLIVLPITGPAAALDRSPTLTTSAPSAVSVGERVTFQAYLRNTSDASYRWNFDDGGTARGWLVSNTFDDPGRYSVIVTAIDDGVRTTATIEITVYPELTGSSGGSGTWLTR